MTPRKNAAKKPAAKKEATKRKASRPTLGGPELRLPSFTAPAALSGAADRVRGNRLVPLMMLLVAAIIAVPLLLSNGEDAKPVRPASAPADGSPTGDSPVPVVAVTNQTGVRDHEKRLDDDGGDPFAENYESGDTGTSSAGGGGASTASGSASSPGSGTGGFQPGGAPVDSGPKWLTHTIDVYAGPAGAKKLKLREDVEQGTVLPNDRAQVAMLASVPVLSPGKALFVLSNLVADVKTTGSCELGGSDCEIVALKPGDSMRLNYADGRSYIVKLVRINRVILNHTPK